MALAFEQGKLAVDQLFHAYQFQEFQFQGSLIEWMSAFTTSPSLKLFNKFITTIRLIISIQLGMDFCSDFFPISIKRFDRIKSSELWNFKQD